MSLTVHTLSLTPAQTAAAQRGNARLARAPRFKLTGWRLPVAQWLNRVGGVASGRRSARLLARRGVQVSTLIVGSSAQPVPVRLLVPETAPRVLVVNLHGGGWVIGSAALDDAITAHFAKAGMVVASVDYRLVDDVKPVWIADAVADCVTALRWALDEGRARFGVDRVVVIGESAGAHLAALALLKLRDEGATRLPDCVFVQGCFDLAGTPSARAAGLDTLLFDGPSLIRDIARLTPGLDQEGRRAPDLSPLHADLAGMPPALFVMSDADPFRDDSRMMANKWSAHAKATLLDVPCAPHGFQHFGAPTAALAQAFIRDWIGTKRHEAWVSVQNSTI